MSQLLYTSPKCQSLFLLEDRAAGRLTQKPGAFFRHRGEILLALDIKPRFLRNIALKASGLRKQLVRGSAALTENRKPETGKKKGSALRRRSRRPFLKLAPEGIVV